MDEIFDAVCQVKHLSSFFFQDVANSNTGTKDSETCIINGLTQGDRLNQLKASRTHSRSATTGRVQ